MRVQAQYEALKNSLIFLLSVGCVNVAFINKYNKPIRIWKTMSKTRFKGFVVSGKMKKLKTIVANQFKPVVYHAEALDGDKSPQLLLDGQESLSIIPFDCGDKFINITVSPVPGLQQVSGEYHYMYSVAFVSSVSL